MHFLPLFIVLWVGAEAAAFLENLVQTWDEGITLRLSILTAPRKTIFGAKGFCRSKVENNGFSDRTVPGGYTSGLPLPHFWRCSTDVFWRRDDRWQNICESASDQRLRGDTGEGNLVASRYYLVRSGCVLGKRKFHTQTTLGWSFTVFS